MTHIMSHIVNLRFLIAFLLTLTFFSSSSTLYSQEELLLRDNLKKAKPSDYIVTSQNKTYTILMVYEITPATLTFEEITVPESKIDLNKISWKQWVQSEAPGHSSWVRYEINLSTGKMDNYYSFSKNSWYNMPEADNFLSTLLNLKMNKIPDRERKRVGSGSSFSKLRPFWAPKVIVNGQTIEGVKFDAWRTYWPKDGSELAGKTIEVYVPQEDEQYPSYFPYWLQISGLIGKAKIRIVDSGSNLISPKPSLEPLKQ